MCSATPEMRAHFIGIGGAGMAPVAQLLAARGWRVSGSDARDSATLDHLRASGITVHVGHDAGHLPREGTVVVSTAVTSTNPELAAARERGLPVIHRSEALALAAGNQDFLAVAGAHGKTTTSGMLAVALREVGQDPSFAVGGRVLDLAASAHLGSGALFIAEADESDGSFLNYRPRIAVVTSIEPDHLDHYGTEAALHEAFDSFAAGVVEGGLLVCCADDPGARGLALRRAGGQRVLTYGTAPPLGEDIPHVQLRDVQVEGHRSRATILGHGHHITLALAVGGIHNLRNATAAWCAGVEAGVAPEHMARGLSAFTGTGRRFETRGEVAGVRVIDDYAHHPTEVAATLRQARAAAGGGRVIVVFQPHLYSRTEIFATHFAHALAAADLAIVTDVYGAREAPREGISGATITQHMPGGVGQYVPAAREAAIRAAAAAQPGDVILTVGAGDVTELGAVILEELGSRA